MAAAAKLLEHSSPKDSLTLRRIARLTGVSAPAIYLHFDNVGKILLAVTRKAFEDLGRQLRTARESATSDPAERIRAVSRAYLDYAETETARYRLMFGGQWCAVDDVEVGDASESDLADLGQDTLDVLTESLEELVAVGERSVELRVASIALWLGLHGLADQRSGTRSSRGRPILSTSSSSGLPDRGAGRSAEVAGWTWVVVRLGLDG